MRFSRVFMVSVALGLGISATSAHAKGQDWSCLEVAPGIDSRKIEVRLGSDAQGGLAATINRVQGSSSEAIAYFSSFSVDTVLLPTGEIVISGLILRLRPEDEEFFRLRLLSTDSGYVGVLDLGVVLEPSPLTRLELQGVPVLCGTATAR
jgi:hypothetical protein